MTEAFEGDKEIVDLAAKLIAAILTKKAIATVAIIFFAGSGGVAVLANAVGALIVPVAQVEVSSPQMEILVEENLAPVKSMMADHANEFAHPLAIREFEDIDRRLDRQDRKTDKIEANLAQASETINRVAAQVEMLVQFQTGRLGVPR